MAVFKCKMCGGDLDVVDGMSVAECEYCGTKQTLPKLDEEQKSNLYDRAGHFRRSNDYDKAMSIYERILDIDNTDAEAYWSLLLCEYGIEYVEDPATHKRIPTVNRAQYTSVFMNENYKDAIKYADPYQKAIYEEEAKTIDNIQKGILEISQNEDAFDVFICYKETDEKGQRTKDSVLAQDLYYQLVQEGYKVFFSRITLEDKIGMAYEPYIFAALNSAKVMVVVGTKPEYFNAVWVKNEWSRFLKLIKSNKNKILIPAYKEMDPYDLPDEFSHLQAQDMSKLGFMQDLIRGIKKIVDASSVDDNTVNENNIVQNVVGNIAPLLDRAFLCIEDSEFKKADELLEQVLNMNPREPKAYIGKLLCELRLNGEEKLLTIKKPLNNYGNYKKAIRFGEGNYIDKIKKYNDDIINEINQNILEIEQQIRDINRKIEQKELEQNDIRNSFSKRKGELEQAIREQEQKKKEIEQEMKKQYDKMECEYTELSRKRKNSTPLHSIFKTKSEDRMIEDLQKLNDAMRTLKKSIVSNPQILECEEMILKIKDRIR